MTSDEKEIDADKALGDFEFGDCGRDQRVWGWWIAILLSATFWVVAIAVWLMLP